MANSKLNIPRVSYIPAHSGSLGNGIWTGLENPSGYTENRYVSSYGHYGINPIFPTHIPFSKKIETIYQSDLGGGDTLSDITSIDLFQNTNYFIEAGYLGFHVRAVVTHSSIKTMSIKILGGVLVTSFYDLFLMDQTSETHIPTNPDNLTNILPDTTPWLWCELPSAGPGIPNVYGGDTSNPSAILHIKSRFNNGSNVAVSNALVSGIITLI